MFITSLKIIAYKYKVLQHKQIDLIFVIILIYYLYFSDWKWNSYEFYKFLVFSDISKQQGKTFLTEGVSSRRDRLVGLGTHQQPREHWPVKLLTGPRPHRRRADRRRRWRLRASQGDWTGGLGPGHDYEHYGDGAGTKWSLEWHWRPWTAATLAGLPRDFAMGHERMR
jgi:hypothetical protein